MEYVFPTLLASLLLIPILFLIKIGLSRTGIIVVACLSFLFVELTLLLQSILPLWQGAFVMLLLMLCVTYFMQTRMKERFFTVQEDLLIHREEVTDEEVLEMDQNIDVFENTTEEELEATYLAELFQSDSSFKKEGRDL